MKDNHLLPKHEIDFIVLEALVHILTFVFSILNFIALMVLLAHFKL